MYMYTYMYVIITYTVSLKTILYNFVLLCSFQRFTKSFKMFIIFYSEHFQQFFNLSVVSCLQENTLN